MNTSHPLYSSNFGQGTAMLTISPGRNCRLFPYVQAPGCSKAINQCKSSFLQGKPVQFEYDLAGNCACDANVSPSAVLDMNGKKCTTSVVQGGCRCSQMSTSLR
jgi:hypothetical protein